MLIKKVTAALLTLTVTITAQTTHALTDGSLDTISQAIFDVTVEIPGRIRMSDLTDFDFGTHVLNTGGVSMNDDICVYTNTSAGTYQVTATGDGTAGAFVVISGGNQIPFRVFWNNQTGTASNQILTAGVAKPSSNADTESETCAIGGNNANIEVEIEGAQLISQPNGTYTGDITLMLEPTI